MQTDLLNAPYNPDVLSCLANLSSDEVFTPPSLANAMLDLLPQELFSDPDATFLDPACKSGVFLREIAKRLLKGLESRIPDLQERANHIFKKQIFGIAITELTAHLSRRSLYCSKTANGEYSVVAFDTEGGNVRFEATEHTWENGKCLFCGAPKEKYDRGDALESHAYAFIHTLTPEELFKMKFDVIVSNPPYQLNDGGGTGSSAVPIYQKFVAQAKKLAANYIVMIIPSRWMTGGKHLDEFRKAMLCDTHIEALHDFVNGNDCFPGVNIEGGVCYFKINKFYSGECSFTLHTADGKTLQSTRYLKEGDGDIVVRDANVLSILEKVQRAEETSFSTIVSKRNPYNIVGDISKITTTEATSRKIFCRRENKRQFLNLRDDVKVSRNKDTISKYKLFVSKADGAAGQLGNPIPARIIGKAEIAGPNTICSETFLCVFAHTRKDAVNIESYMRTKFFRLLVAIRKNKNMTHDTYRYVPMQDFSKAWTDEELYKKYKLTQEEIAFIESMIKPMD